MPPDLHAELLANLVTWGLVTLVFAVRAVLMIRRNRRIGALAG